MNRIKPNTIKYQFVLQCNPGSINKTTKLFMNEMYDREGLKNPKIWSLTYLIGERGGALIISNPPPTLVKGLKNGNLSKMKKY